jgi:hypothetical protein
MRDTQPEKVFKLRNSRMKCKGLAISFFMPRSLPIYHELYRFHSKTNGEAIGLHKLIDEFSLPVNRPAVRSEVVRGARKTRIADGIVLEQYPPTYAPTDMFGHLRFAMRYEPIDLNQVSLDILLTLKGEDSYRVYTARLYGSPRWVPVAGGITAPLA